MKTPHLIALLLLSAVTFSCTKDKETPVCCVLPESPFITAKKNTIFWSAGPSAQKMQGTDSIAIFGAKGNDLLVIHVKSKQEGIYTLTSNEAKFYTLLGGDVITSEYNLDNSAQNTLTILKLKNGPDIINGTYSLTLKKLNSPSTAEFPATIKFTDGMFQATIK